PQAFLFKVIKKAYDLAYGDHFYATDDAALVERMGGRVRIIEGSPFNIKITTPEDLEMVEYFLKKKQWSSL
ncbi:MAG: 2-C-methyl-D-erythritol 4-phosphate cytidylyltransferase, partial [Thermodesulfovibrionia bacterium]|nr:2-C-methyl-D-erythritol 4-phosphate cytidylyltransferase [Thermodesulfovibrionia bacterium]